MCCPFRRASLPFVAGVNRPRSRLIKEQILFVLIPTVVSASVVSVCVTSLVTKVGRLPQSFASSDQRHGGQLSDREALGTNLGITSSVSSIVRAIGPSLVGLLMQIGGAPAAGLCAALFCLLSAAIVQLRLPNKVLKVS